MVDDMMMMMMMELLVEMISHPEIGDLRQMMVDLYNFHESKTELTKIKQKIIFNLHFVVLYVDQHVQQLVDI